MSVLTVAPCFLMFLCLELPALPFSWCHSDTVSSTKFCGGLLCSILVSCGCSDTWPRTSRLKTTNIYFPTVLEARSLKSVSLGWNWGAVRAVLPPGALRDNLSLASSNFQWLLAFFGLWPHHSVSTLWSHHLLLFCLSYLLLSLSQDMWDGLCPPLPQIIQDNLLISRL